MAIITGATRPMGNSAMFDPFRTLTAALLATLVLHPALGQTIYRWVDRDGRVHYSAERPRDASGTRTVKGAGAPPPPSALDKAVAANPVTLYQTAECDKPCRDARGLLAKRGVPFRTVDVDTQEKLAELQKVSGIAGVPVLRVGPTVIKGYQMQSWNQALDLAGYPGSPPSASPGTTPDTAPGTASDAAPSTAPNSSSSDKAP
jgi:glutaredoxin